MQDLDALRRRAARAFAGQTPEMALNRVRAIVGTSNLPATFEGELAKSALDKLQNAGDRPTPRELAALELMLRMMRPAPKLLAAGVDKLVEAEFQQAFPEWGTFRDLLKPLSASIGRIDVGKVPAGTGFLIGPDKLVTNRHVLEKISMGTRVLEEGQAVVGFRWLADDVEDPQPILGVIAFDESFDIALLRVKPQAGRTPLKLAAGAPKPERRVAVIGHPYDDPVNNPMFTRTIFGNRWGVKRAAPGEVIWLSKPGTIAGHDCSTLGGNSGSPVLALDTGEVVGLHFGGSFLWRNEAVSAPTLAEFASKHA
jgi:endonuclease G, mitochondrial